MNALPRNIRGLDQGRLDRSRAIDAGRVRQSRRCLHQQEVSLDQNGLADGGDIVMKFLNAGELGMALEHLIYMVQEPALPISPRTYACIKSAGRAMGMDERLWEKIRPAGDAADG